MLSIQIPENVKIKIQDTFITVKGPQGLFIKKKDKNLKLYINDNKIYFLNSVNTLYYNLLYNFFWGVTKGYIQHLKLNGVGYRVSIDENKLILRLGFSHSIEYAIPKSIEIYNPAPTDIIIRGFNKQLVNQVASEIRRYKYPEPYKGKGILYVNEKILLKEGKKK
jgi:large subunit ribosomal protein L6